ncbi:copper-binding protein [Herbaspirillum sp. RTI4]|uniref:copper-binding protein n=1 Tax=Herbaspirillum sp. RTI4 TaxID=3048640 RepID=UPI002AB39029|nr:copper-binding protein [Herbaspirillum sp. RTI4]MDY7579072.1 copper-binding protein [Herbaspirillum sp. RTI4]MEA9982344.1 copper-binding protein [Herbaspirillum sp. RTI4]
MKTIPTIFLTAGLLIATTLPLNAVAQPATPEAKPSAQIAGNTADMTDGEVKKIDKDAGKITLRHGDIKNLDMPGMTMVFTAKDKSLLDKVKPGDKVKFRAIIDNGKLTVTDLEPIE